MNMEEQSTQIIAIITTVRENFIGGGVPIFVAKRREGRQTISSTLGKTLDASAHEVDQETMIMVKHKLQEAVLCSAIKSYFLNQNKLASLTKLYWCVKR